MMARAHMERWGTTREQLAEVAVKNHKHGSLNPHAQYRQTITVADVLRSAKVADPLNVLDCSPITDGAAAVVLADLATAKKLAKKRPVVKVAGIGVASDRIALHDRPDMTTIPATTEAGRRALAMAGRKTADVQVVELHDCFTIAEIVVLESLGLCPPGKGGEQAPSGHTALGGALPVNPSGGLKSKGHPVGATGIAQIVELATQLRGEAGPRQVKGARVALAQNMGGTGASSVVTVLEVAS
jgi:acetyl-CoA C-acetyltransferase